MVLGKLKDLKKLREQALQMQRDLAQQRIEIEHQGVRVVMSGDQQVISLEVDGTEYPRIREAVNKAIKESQIMAAKKLAQMGSGLAGGA